MKTDPLLLDRARRLRREMSQVEQRLWRALRDRRFDGIKFVRQTVNGSAITDFCCRARKLVIEVDGDTHAAREAADAARSARLERQGFRVIRFNNADVMGNLEGVLATISAALGAPPHPGPLPEGEREQTR